MSLYQTSIWSIYRVTSDLVLFQPWHSPLSKWGEKVFDSWQVVVVHLLVIVVDYLEFVQYVVVDVHIVVVHSDLVALAHLVGAALEKLLLLRLHRGHHLGDDSMIVLLEPMV